MAVSGANNHHPRVQSSLPQLPPAKTEPAAQKATGQKPVEQKPQTQPTQYQASLQKDKYEEPKKGQENKVAASGQTPHEQRNAGGTDAQDNVPELGASSSTGVDKSGEGQNAAGTDKQSAVELMNNSKVDGKENYEQLTPEDKGAEYGQQKKDLFKAATDAGASREEAAIMTSQFMLEGGRDASKDDKTDGSKNFGPLNLNEDLLKKQGMSAADMEEMNKLENGKPTQKALELTAKAAHTAMQEMGVNGYLHHVRGGQTGFEKPDQKVDPTKPGLKQDDPSAFARTVAESAKQYLAEGLNDNKRYAAMIPPI